MVGVSRNDVVSCGRRGLARRNRWSTPRPWASDDPVFEQVSSSTEECIAQLLVVIPASPESRSPSNEAGAVPTQGDWWCLCSTALHPSHSFPMVSQTLDGF